MPIKDPVRRRAYQRIYMARWRAANPERNREIGRRSDRNRDPVVRARHQHEKYERNGEKYLARRRANYAADPEPTRAANRAYYARHREKLVAYARAYRRRA
jgi:hypothetical protein